MNDRERSGKRHFYRLQGDEPLQVDQVVGLQDGLRGEPASVDHQQAGEHAQEPDVDQQVEQHQPRQQDAEAQQALLPQRLGHGGAGGPAVSFRTLGVEGGGHGCRGSI